MLAVKTRTNADSVFTAASTVHYSLVGDYGDEVDQLPRGTALNAARSPVTKEVIRSATFPNQLTRATVSSKHTFEVAKTARDKSTSSNDNSSGNHADVSLLLGSTETKISEKTEPSRKVSNGPDLARRAAQRVNVWKKSEQERREEEERARQVKLDQDKHRQNYAAHVKQRRRAEIYALNEILRHLQQEKVARYIAAQKELREESKASFTNILGQVRAVGV